MRRRSTTARAEEEFDVAVAAARRAFPTWAGDVDLRRRSLRAALKRPEAVLELPVAVLPPGQPARPPQRRMALDQRAG